MKTFAFISALALTMTMVGAQTIDRTSPAYKGADKNKDGKLNREEMMDYMAAQTMAEYDTNKDGKITKDEMAKKNRVNKTNADIQFRAADLNKDGKITKDEAAAAATQSPKFKAVFDGIDSDEDGFVNEQEFNSWNKYTTQPKDVNATNENGGQGYGARFFTLEF